MLDRALLGLSRPALGRTAQRLAGAGVSADAVTLCGLGFGVAAAVAIVVAQPLLGLALIGASRLADGLDGELARATMPTDRGAFLDITLHRR